MNTVWLVIKEAVYDHGVCYIARTEDEARAFCREWAPDKDGHHDWRIQEAPVGEPVRNDGIEDWHDGDDTPTRVVDLPARGKYGNLMRDRSDPEVVRMGA